MDTLHSMLSSIRTETKASKPHVSVFREFLAHLDEVQRLAAPAPRAKAPLRRKSKRRGRAG
jgi:hypothetical protein